MHTISYDLTSDRRRPRVLVVEDDVLVALDMEQLLLDNGCEVVGRSMTAMEALAFLDSEEIDIAIIDYVLKDGTAECVTLALHGKGIPFAICTGRGEGEMRAVYPQTPILRKPYGADDFARLVDTLIAGEVGQYTPRSKPI